MKSLAIEREFGSGGREVGLKVAETAGISYYDSNLLDKVTERYGESANILNSYDEKWTGSLLFNISMAAGYSQGMTSPRSIRWDMRWQRPSSVCTEMVPVYLSDGARPIF